VRQHEFEPVRCTGRSLPNRRRERAIKGTKAPAIFAWGLVGIVWLACGLQIMSEHPEIPFGSVKGLRFLLVDSMFAIFVLGGAHFYLQRGLMKIVDRFNIDSENPASMARLNRFGILMIFLEIVLIYQAATLVFETFIL
jgi:hypothetical protein